MSFGIPPLLNQIGADISTGILLVSDVLIGINGFTLSGNQAVNAAINAGVYAGIPTVPMQLVWGIYDDEGNQVLVPDSVISLDYRNESRVPDYPVEGGTFAQYNKTASPYTARVQMAMGSTGAGSQPRRQQFLTTLDRVANDTNLYQIVTPEKVYYNANIIGYDYRRTASAGAGMIMAELSLVEIRVTAQAAFSNPKNPSDTNQTQNAAAPVTATTPPKNIVL